MVAYTKSIEPSVPTSITLAQFCYPNPPFHYPRSTTLPEKIHESLAGFNCVTEKLWISSLVGEIGLENFFFWIFGI